jgi:hypothetical protein
MVVVKPFSLQLPTGRPVDVVVLRDDQGNLLVRGAHEVTPHPLQAAKDATGKPGGV